MLNEIETIVIGGGQAGLATSYYLRQHGREHLVLEKSAQAGHAWRNDRWDSFCLLTPNWSFRLPGMEYYGPDPDGFMPRDEIVARFEGYIDRFRLPVHFQRAVQAVEYNQEGSYYRVVTEQATLEARNVVIATGLFQAPKLPGFAAEISPAIVQLHSSRYRNPEALPPGAVLVVGSAQSGCQIAEELNQAGRTVYLSTGSAGRIPRRYRGKDTFEWLLLSGMLDRTADQLPSQNARFAGSAHVSGKNGGYTLNLHQFYRDGIRLLGHLQAADQDKVWLAPDLKENLAKADQFEKEIVRIIDEFISESGVRAPEEALPVLSDGFGAEELGEIQLSAAGISAIIWATGYSFDFSLVKLPVFDDTGYPIQKRGVTAYPGLYFVGLPWLYRQKSGLLFGFGEDAELIASHISMRNRRD